MAYSNVVNVPYSVASVPTWNEKLDIALTQKPVLLRSSVPGTVSPAPAPPTPVEMLTNPGMEAPYSGGNADGWSDNAYGGADLTQYEVTTNPHSGTSAQGLSITTIPDGSGHYFYQPLSTEPGVVYEVSMWVRSDDGAKIRLYLRNGDPDYQRICELRHVPSATWEQISFRGGYQEGFDNAQLCIAFATPGSVVIDDLSVKVYADDDSIPLTGAIPQTLFGMHINKWGTYPTWPRDKTDHGLVRMWDTGTEWTSLEATKGNWNWTRLDLYMDAVTTEEVIMTLGRSPTWASSRGKTYPPDDINDWTNYVTTVATRYQGKINYYEVWNEVNYAGFYEGTMAELVTLTNAAATALAAVDPNIKLLSPNYTITGMGDLSEFLDLGGATNCDIISYHEYPLADPEHMIGCAEAIRSELDHYGVSLPIWNTEGVNKDPGYTYSLDKRKGLIVRDYATLWAYGVEIFGWYAWDIVEQERIELSVLNNYDTYSDCGPAYPKGVEWLEGATYLDRATPDNDWHIQMDMQTGYGHLLWTTDVPTIYTLDAGLQVDTEEDVDSNSYTFVGPPDIITTTNDSVAYDLTPYVDADGSALSNWTVVNAVPGFSFPVDDGILVMAANTASSEYVLQITVDNAAGTSIIGYVRWVQYTEPAAPQWTGPIDDISSDIADPQPVDHSFAGLYTGFPAPSFSISPAVPGFSISGTNVRMDGADAGAHSITVVADNSVPPTDSTSFTWTITAPGEYFEYFPADETSFTKDFSELGLSPIDQDFAVQAVYGLKQDMASSSQFHVFHRTKVAEQANASGYRFEIRTDLEGVSLQIGNNSGAFLNRTDFPTNGLTKSTVCDFRYRAQGGSIKSWLNKGDLDSKAYTHTAIDPINQLVHLDNQMRLIALRIVTPAPDDSTVLAWPDYSYPTPTLPSYNDRTGIAGDAVSFDASQGATNLELGAWSAAGLPTGLTIDPDTGEITGTLPAAQVFNPVVTYTQDSIPYSQGFTWTVEAVPTGPDWTTIPDTISPEGELPEFYSVAEYATSNGGALYGWELVTPPAGFTINNQSGQVKADSGTAIGTHKLTVSVSDDWGASTTTFDWRITAGVLYDGSEVSHTTTTSTGEVYSTTSVGTLYAAVRLSGPYLAGDELDIALGTDAAWIGNASPVIGKNTFIADGLDPGQEGNYWWGTVILLRGDLPDKV